MGRRKNSNQNPNQDQKGYGNGNRGSGGPYPPCRHCHKTDHEPKYCGYNINGAKPFECKTFGCPTPKGNHMTKNCPIAKANKIHDHNGNQQKYCTNCNRSGHDTSDCRTRRAIDVTMASPIVTSQPYCEYCNTTEHQSSVCPSDDNKLNWHDTRLKCSRCRARGHTSDVCKNPARKDCDFCLAPGHEKAHCPLRQNKNKQECKTPTTAIRRTFRPDDTAWRSRFKVLNETELTSPLVKRRAWEDYKLEYQQKFNQLDESDKVLAKSQLQDMEREMLRSERHLFKGGPKSPVTASSRKRQIASRPVAAQGLSQIGSVRPTMTFPLAGRSTRAASVAAHYGHDIAWLDQAAQNQLNKDMTESEIKIIRKIALSRVAYPLQEISLKIVRHEIDIIYATGVSREKMADLKGYIQRGARVFRDPLTFAALFGRKVPVCNTCGENGTVFDGQLLRIDPMERANMLYVIDDHSNPEWGIFILFCCEARCSKNGYRFEKMPKSMMGDVDMTHPEYRPWGELAWEV